MKNTLRKLLAMMMSVMMLCGSLPINVIAEGIDNMMPELGEGLVFQLPGDEDDGQDGTLPMQDASAAYSLAGDGGIALLAADTAPSGGVYLNEVMVSKYSATAWDGYKSGTTVTTFIGSTRYIRYRIQPKGSTGKVKVVVKQYLNGQLYNGNYPIDRIGDNGDSWDSNTNTFNLNTIDKTASVYPVGFTPTADMKAGDEISFELFVYDEDGEAITYDVKDGYSKEVKFVIQSEDKKYDYEIQLYRAIKGDEDVYSYNSSDKIDFLAGTEIRFRVQIHSLCDKDMYIKLVQSWNSSNVSSTTGLDDLTYKIIERNDDPDNEAEINGDTVFLPAGATVLLGADSYKEFTLVTDGKGKDMKFTYTVTATLDKTQTGANIDYDPKEEKTVTCTQVTKLGDNNVGYNLAIASAHFENADFSGGEQNIGGINMRPNGLSAGGAEKWVHTTPYSEGKKVTITSETPVDDDGNIFLFWYDKRALGDERFIRPGGFIYKDNTNDHTIDAIWAHLPATGTIEIHNGEPFFVATEGIELVGENREYSKESVFANLDITYSFKLEQYIDDGSGNPKKTELYTSGEYTSTDAFASDAYWTHTDIGHYVYTITAMVKDKKQSTTIATTSATADVEILPRPVVVVANTKSYPFDGTEYNVNDKDYTDAQVPANRPYTVWSTIDEYAPNGTLNSRIAGILNEVYKASTGENMPDVEYTQEDVYLPNDDWKTAKDQMVTVLYGPDKATGKTYPGTYTAYIDMPTLPGAEKFGSTDAYTVYMVGNYVYILLNGDLTITPAYLQFDKTVKDDSVESATFTFEVHDAEGNVVHFNDEYVQDPDGNIVEFTLTYPDDDPLISELLTVYTNKEGGFTYTVVETDIVRTPASDKTYTTEYEWTCTNGESEDLSGEGNAVQIPLNETGTVHVSNIMEPEISLDKSLFGDVPEYTNSKGNVVNGFRKGETITWTLTVKNEGNRTLYNVELTDGLDDVRIVSVSSSNTDRTFAGPYSNPLTIGEMAVGETVTVTVEYDVTQADIDANRPISNDASVTGEDSDHEEVDDDDDDEEPIVWDPAIEIVKTLVGEASEGGYALNDTITWTLTVTNIGTVTLTNVEVEDELTGNTFTADDWDATNGTWASGDDATAGTLEPGETVTFTTAVYTVTQTDVDAGHVYNVATVKAKDPKDKDVTDDDDDDEPTDHDPAIKIVKTLVGEAPEGGYELNDTIVWSLVVTNTGNVTLHDVKVEDELTGDTFTAEDWNAANGTWAGGDDATAGTLEPGETVTFTTAVYTVTQADVDAGHVYNVATVKATDPRDDDTEDPEDKELEDEDDDDEPTRHTPAIAVTKTLADPGSKPAAGYGEGDTITWTVTVTNTGNLTLHDVVLTDELTGVTITNVKSSDEERSFDGPYTNPLTIGTLAVGEVVTVTVDYVVTTADVLAKDVTNKARANGEDPDGEPVEDEDDDTEPTVEAKPHLSLTKVTTSKPANGTAYVRGEVITYEIVVTNDGNVMLVDVTVEDELTGNVWTVPSLAPGESATFTTKHTVTADDVAAGHVLNVATADSYVPKNPGDPSNPGNPNDPSNPNDPADPNNPNHAQRVTADPCSVDDPTTTAASAKPTETPTNTPTTPNTVTSNPPKTGDDSQMSLWMALLIISACGMLVMLIPARKRVLGHKGKNK